MFLNTFIPNGNSLYNTFKSIQGHNSQPSAFMITNNSLMRFRRVQENSVRGNLIKGGLGLIATISGQRYILPILGSIPSNYIWAGVVSLFRVTNLMLQRTVGVATGLFMTSSREKLAIDIITPNKDLIGGDNIIAEIGAGIGWDDVLVPEPSMMGALIAPFQQLIEDEVTIAAESAVFGGLFSVLGSICSPLITIAEITITGVAFASVCCGNYIGARGISMEGDAYILDYNPIKFLVESLGGEVPTLSLLCAGSAASGFLIILYWFRYKTKDYALAKTQDTNESLVNLIKDLQKSENMQVNSIIEKASIKLHELQANNAKLDILNVSLSEELANLKLVAATIIT
jgi:hypothetical protein